MNIIKSFVGLTQFTNNSPDTIAKLGELSSLSRTYAKDKTEYQDGNFPGYTLTVFRASDADTSTLASPSTDLVSTIFKIVNKSIEYAKNNIRPFSSDDYLTYIKAELIGLFDEFTIGSFIDNGSTALPEWFSFKTTDGLNFSKVWLCDDSFAEQYDEYNITVVPPVDNLDIFFSSYSVAVTKLAERTLSQTADKIQEAKDGYPETYLRIYEFPFVNTTDTTKSTKVGFPVLIYGIAGDNIDAIKEAIIAYLLANSHLIPPGD